MPPCLVGMEACVGPHHLSRKLKALGHDARLMPAKYVHRADTIGLRKDTAIICQPASSEPAQNFRAIAIVSIHVTAGPSPAGSPQSAIWLLRREIALMVGNGKRLKPQASRSSSPHHRASKAVLVRQTSPSLQEQAC
jgi:hypothetical protein